MSAPPPNKKRAPEKKQAPAPQKQQQQKESSEPSGLDPAPLLEKYARYGVYLRWLWPIASVSFVVAAIFIFSTIPGNYKALQPGQHVVAVVLNPQDSSSLLLAFTEGKYLTTLESKDGGKHYQLSQIDTLASLNVKIDSIALLRLEGHKSAAK